MIGWLVRMKGRIYISIVRRSNRNQCNIIFDSRCRYVFNSVKVHSQVFSSWISFFFCFFVTCSILSKVEDLTTGLSHFSLKINTSSPIEEVFSSFTFSTIMVLIVLNGSIQSFCVSLQEEKFPKSPQDIDLESAGQKLLASLPNLNKVWDLIKRREVFCRLETIIWSCTVIYNFILDNKKFHRLFDWFSHRNEFQCWKINHFKH